MTDWPSSTGKLSLAWSWETLSRKFEDATPRQLETLLGMVDDLQYGTVERMLVWVAGVPLTNAFDDIDDYLTTLQTIKERTGII